MHLGSARRLVALATAATVLAALGATPVAAVTGATIHVTAPGDTLNDDPLCTLREAVSAAEDNAPVGGCTAGTGTGSVADTIVFDVAGPILLDHTLPDITTAITIDGGAAGMVIDGQGKTAMILCQSTAILTLRRLTFQNGSSGYGGAVYTAGQSTLDRVVVKDSVATFWGGGVNTAVDSSLEVVDSLIAGNAAPDGAGLYLQAGTTVTIRRSTIADNTATASGGGILAKGTLTLVNSTIAGNTAAYGGGIYVPNSSTIDVLHATVTGNTSGTDSAGGIDLDSTTTTSLRNSIVSGNSSNGGANPNTRGTWDTSTGNLVDADAAALFDPAGLALNGGLTPTIPLRKTATAAIDTADDTACGAAGVEGRDQRGVTRPQTTCDIGAVELDRTAPTITSAPKTSLRADVALNGGVQVRVSWAGADNTGGSGIDGYILERSTDGGAYKVVYMGRAASKTFALPTGKTYRFRVRAVDYDENLSTRVGGPSFAARLVQQTSSAFSYKGTWTTKSDTRFSGGSVKFAKAKGASFSFTATGRSYAFITTTGPTRGKAKVYVNGTYLTTIDLRSDATTFRVQKWAKTYSTSKTRTIRIVVLGTTDRPRVDADAFAALK